MVMSDFLEINFTIATNHYCYYKINHKSVPKLGEVFRPMQR